MTTRTRLGKAFATTVALGVLTATVAAAAAHRQVRGHPARHARAPEQRRRSQRLACGAAVHRPRPRALEGRRHDRGSASRTTATPDSKSASCGTSAPARTNSPGSGHAYGTRSAWTASAPSTRRCCRQLRAREGRTPERHAGQDARGYAGTRDRRARAPRRQPPLPRGQASTRRSRRLPGTPVPEHDLGHAGSRCPCARRAAQRSRLGGARERASLGGASTRSRSISSRTAGRTVLVRRAYMTVNVALWPRTTALIRQPRRARQALRRADGAGSARRPATPPRTR